MKRSELKRTPAKPKCRHCKKKLGERERGIHSGCVDGWYEANREKIAKKAAVKRAKEAKAERVQTRARKEAIKSRGKWLAECQAIVNKLVRLRDKDKPCCSCDRPASWDGQWHASHFRSVGAASGLRFHLWNIHKGCSICNNHLSGNIAGYRPRIIARIGAERVQWLDAQNAVVKHKVDYLKRFKAVMGKRLRRMEKSI